MFLFLILVYFYYLLLDYLRKVFYYCKFESFKEDSKVWIVLLYFLLKGWYYELVYGIIRRGFK